jgi:hypothetical protein
MDNMFEQSPPQSSPPERAMNGKVEDLDFIDHNP